MKILEYIREKPVALLLLAVPIAIIAELLHADPLWVFALSALAVIPMASYIGEATEALAHYTGPRLGGLLNATLGNAAELIITIVAIRRGLLELVKASITGSILGNVLLVMGMAMLLGGRKHGVQQFDRRSATTNAILLVLAVLILTIPSVFNHTIEIGPNGFIRVEALSLGVAGIMIVLYALGLLYTFRTSGHVMTAEAGQPETPHPGWPFRTALIVLGLATVGVAYFSELLVGSVEPVIEELGISEFFIGIIFIPIIGNVAEHLVAVQVAIKNKMTLSVEIAIGSSLQIALFVAPVLVFISLLLGNPLTLVFNQFELLALIAGVLVTAIVAMDGESNWLEGTELLAIYLILGLAFFLLPV